MSCFCKNGPLALREEDWRRRRKAGLSLTQGVASLPAVRTARAWWNGRHARLRIWSRKGWRFKSSRAHQIRLSGFWSQGDDDGLEVATSREANKDGTKS